MSQVISDFSIRSVCDLVGIEPEKKTFGEVFPAAEFGGVVLRLARQKDSTCVYVRCVAEEGS